MRLRSSAGGRALAGLLDRVDRELDRDAAGLADAVADPLGELEMVAVAGREVGAGLGDADDRLARLELLAADAVVQVALEVERGHVGVGRVVEPGLRPELQLGSGGCAPFPGFFIAWFPGVSRWFSLVFEGFGELVPTYHENVGDMAQGADVDIACRPVDQSGEMLVDGGILNVAAVHDQFCR